MKNWSLRQKDEVVQKIDRPIVISGQMKKELSILLGEDKVKLLEDSIGIQEKAVRGNPGPDFVAPPVWKNAWGDNVARPKYQIDPRPHPSKIHGQIYWPNMTNDQAKFPVKIELPEEVTDLQSWLRRYGEPTPDKIPTGTMTTFEKSRKRVGKEKSQSVGMVHKVSGREWRQVYDKIVKH
jgi:hypothetical protein